MRILSRAVSCVLAAMLWFIPMAAASEGPPPILNIKTYTSPSGRFALTVDPSRLHGQGKGSYRMVADGKEVWAKEIDFTFWEACVTDDGLAAGYAYTNGWRGMDFSSPRKGNGDFVVAIINADGSPRMDNRFPRTEGGLHSAPNPVALGCFLDPHHNRFVIRFHSPERDMLKRGEQWEAYSLAKDGPTATLNLAAPDLGQNGFSMVVGTRAVPGTGLVLVSSHVHTFGQAPHQGLRLSLVDKECREVWSKDWPDEFTKIERFVAWMLESDELTPADPQEGRFAYHSLSEQARITFSASKDPAGQWKVEETGRVPEAVALRYFAQRERKITAQPIQLEPKGVISLAAGAGEDEEALGVGAFGFDAAGRIGFVSNRSQPFEFVLIDPAAPPAKRIPLDMSHEDKLAFPQTAWIGGTRWVILRASYDDSVPTLAFILDTAKPGLTPVEGFTSPPPEMQHGVSGNAGGFAILGSYRSNEVFAYDADGKQRWNLPPPGVSPQAIAVRSDGRVGILIGISNQIVVISAAGKVDDTIELEQSMDHKPNYVSSLAEDTDGGWILHDFSGSPPVYRLDAAGKVKSQFTPHYPDGRTFRIAGGVQRAPDGRLWTSDSAALLRLNDEGQVDLVVGRKPDAESLSQLRSLSVDLKGQIYALDGRNNWIHVFDSAGKRLRQLKPDPRDFEINDGLGSLTVAGDGSVYVRPNTFSSNPMQRPGYLKFGPDGNRIGMEKGISGEVVDDWYFRPGSQERLVLGYERAFLVGPDGQKTKPIERRADRKWLDHPHQAAVAADGSFAIVARPSSWLGEEVASLTMFSASGEPQRTVDLPGTQFARVSFNGKQACVVDAETLWVVDAASGGIGAFEIPGGKKQQWWYPQSSPDGREVWLLDAEAKAIHRYAVP